MGRLSFFIAAPLAASIKKRNFRALSHAKLFAIVINVTELRIGDLLSAFVSCSTKSGAMNINYATMLSLSLILQGTFIARVTHDSHIVSVCTLLENSPWTSIAAFLIQRRTRPLVCTYTFNKLWYAYADFLNSSRNATFFGPHNASARAPSYQLARKKKKQIKRNT